MSDEGKSLRPVPIDPGDPDVIKEVQEIARGVARTYRLDGFDAEDIAQSVLARLVKYRPVWKGKAPRTTYLRAVVKREIIDQWNKSDRGMNVPIDEEAVTAVLASEDPGPERAAEAHETAVILEEIVKTVFDNQDLEILRLHILGYRSKEIADRLGISDDNARKRTSLAMLKLRARVKELRVER